MAGRREQISALRDQYTDKEQFLEALKSSRLRPAAESGVIPFAEEGRLMHPKSWLFNEKNGNEHAQVRRDIESGMRHVAGIPVHALIGLIDGIVDALTVGAGELAEDLTFFAGYTSRRVVDGWKRGRQGGTGE
jgi:hypothetical protein